MNTAKFKLPFIYSAQAKKEVTHNEALAIIDSLINPVVHDEGIKNYPPASVTGDMFIIRDDAEGDLEGKGGHLACRLEGGWHITEPQKWMSITTLSSGQSFRFDGQGWQDISPDDGMDTKQDNNPAWAVNIER